MLRKIFIILNLLLISSVAFADIVESLGEAEIVGNDVPSAKNIAISRAKWSALEQASSVKISLDSIISNAELAEEAVKSELSAVVKGFKIVDEGRDGNIYWVAIRAEILPDEAKNVINGLSKNTSIAVAFPAILPDGSILVHHPFTSTVTRELIEKGFEVTDISDGGIIPEKVIINAIKTKNYTELRNISRQYMISGLLLGEVKISSKGNDIGYMKVNFSLVSGELDWKLIGDKGGIITSGSISSRGQGATEKDAAYNLLKNMSKTSSVKVVSSVSQKIFGSNSKTVRVALKGESNIRYFRELREDIKNIPFVLDVKEQGINAVFVDYPEKTYYLATFLSNGGKYIVVRMDDDEIILERR